MQCICTAQWQGFHNKAHLFFKMLQPGLPNNPDMDHFTWSGTLMPGCIPFSMRNGIPSILASMYLDGPQQLLTRSQTAAFCLSFAKPMTLPLQTPSLNNLQIDKLLFTMWGVIRATC